MSGLISMALTLEQKLELGASDLRFLLTNHGIKDTHQGSLFEAGVDTMAKFAAFVTTAADLADVLKKEFSLDAAASLANRAQVASYTVAWQSAQARTKQQAEVEATNETREWAKPIPVSDYIAMRQRFAKAFGEPEDKHIPAKEYIEKKLAELETGEFRAETLGEILSRDEVDPDVLVPHWDAKGHLSVKRGSSSVALPTGPEQLRLRLTVMYNALAMIKLKHPGRNELADISADLFEKYKDYLLGDYVYGLRSAEAAGAMIPPWTLVLGYEHAIRKFANKLVSQEGYKFGEALKKAWKDATIKERHFISPLSLYGKRTADAPSVPFANTEKGKGGKKGGKKGSAKNKDYPSKNMWQSGKGSSRTPENKPICFRYNAKGGCKKGAKCHFTHVCSLCFGGHPRHQCPTASAAKAADTQGANA